MKRLIYPLILLPFACGVLKPTDDPGAVDQLEVGVASFTQREEHPGVESDLISVTTWVVELKKPLSPAPQIIALLYGESHIYPSGEQTTNSARQSTLRMTFSRANYREGSQPFTDQPELPRQGIDLEEGKYAVLLSWKDRLRWVELPAPEVLPSVYYP